ncbi:50S ribosomal protein L5 [Candidatus Kaiserbacteria bacterium CG10_big_fil_rev_8_21_14_0_10_43_70]|uniref:Large ribosomal subunit protein uL5 n=1 Tax=Candidatus Kaiserbacteria bacterium CG10_big_fil_rev_8_21_14_0_10_43_70 TaxID=1974605 RepID=A0A2H0UJG7_9BACT|nr:MAG: 50S ribosomal protein L5 [Candidatus Kaiserbacteria bacterium CG10_big_fil_rev_8_21_14_0_10_43_70]
METVREKQNTIFDSIKERFGYKNKMQSPRITKVVVSSAIGSISDKKKVELIADRIALITGQKPAEKNAKKSIAAFKVREGDLSGYQVTLRGARMHTFLDKLIHIALPRTRDFRGLKTSAIDEMGNFTIGIKEHTVFPETADEDLKDVFGFAITIVTTAKTKEEAEALFRGIGFPIRDRE